MDEQGRVAAIIHDEIGALAIRPGQGFARAPPVLLDGLALPGEDGRAGLGDGRRRRVVRGEDVAAGPAHIGAQRLQRLDEDGRLHRHVQRAHDARALEGLLRAILAARLHEPGHFGLFRLDQPPAQVGQRDVLNLVLHLRVHA